jgi:hypothetical protein
MNGTHRLAEESPILTELSHPAADLANIPHSERHYLLLTIADARQRGAEGRVSWGYTLLIRGLLHAEQAVIREAAWAPSLLVCWRDAINSYCEQYGLGEDIDE